jgi:hypothetical protein
MFRSQFQHLGLPYATLPEGEGGGGQGGGAAGGQGGNGQGGGAGASGTGDAGKTFTQAELDSIIAERLRRAVPADYGDLKTQAAELAKLKEASASDTEKAVNKAAREAEARVRAELTTERILDRAEVLAAKGWADSRDARLRLADRARAGEFTGSDGAINVDAIKTALEAELKSSPYLAATTGPGRPGVDHAQGTGGSSNQNRAAAGLAEAQRRFPKTQ